MYFPEFSTTINPKIKINLQIQSITTISNILMQN